MQVNPNAPSVITLHYESDSDKIERLEQEKAALQIELAVEKKSRFEAEKEVERLKNAVKELEKTRRKRRPEAPPDLEYSEFKVDGKRKARPAESIRSYEDFVAIQNYFLGKDDKRDWMLWTIGVSLGLRISDLLSLKYKHIMHADKSFRERITIIEKKTHKANDCLITESVKYAVKQYLISRNSQPKMDDYLFVSAKTKSRMTEEYGWKILSDAGKALNLPIVIGSHTMRKSFANIVACVNKSVTDMNTIGTVQGLLNHSDPKVTMTYLGTFKTMYDNGRRAVSDFVMGKTDVHKLIAGNNYTIDDAMNRLDKIEALLHHDIDNRSDDETE